MQQTEQYKLNKPGMDDPISITPLNENADKVDSALAALEQRLADTNRRQVLHKLLSAAPEEGAKTFTLDLSDVDLTQYGAAVMFFSIYDCINTTSMRILNAEGTAFGSMALFPGVGHATAGRHAGGVAFFIPAGDRIFGVCMGTTYALSTSNGTYYYGHFPIPWGEAAAMKFDPISDQSTITLYGVRF